MYYNLQEKDCFGCTFTVGGRGTYTLLSTTWMCVTTWGHGLEETGKHPFWDPEKIGASNRISDTPPKTTLFTCHAFGGMGLQGGPPHIIWWGLHEITSLVFIVLYSCWISVILAFRILLFSQYNTNIASSTMLWFSGHTLLRHLCGAATCAPHVGKLPEHSWVLSHHVPSKIDQTKNDTDKTRNKFNHSHIHAGYLKYPPIQSQY